MKLTVNEDLTIQLEEVFSGITLKTTSGETMSICMRDSGFEFNYQGKWYFAKEGYVELVGKKDKPSPEIKDFFKSVADEKGNIALQFSTIGKAMQEATNLKQQSQREIQLINENARLQAESASLQDENIQLQAETTRLQLAFDSCSKELNEVNVKLQNRELITKEVALKEYEQVVGWYRDEKKEKNKTLDLLHEIQRNQWYSRFVNIDKIMREIALEKAIKEKM